MAVPNPCKSFRKDTIQQNLQEHVCVFSRDFLKELENDSKTNRAFRGIPLPNSPPTFGRFEGDVNL